MKRKKVIVISIISILVIILAIYLAASVNISLKVSKMMEENYNSYGKKISEQYSNFISSDDYEYACYRSDDADIVSEKKVPKFPRTIWWWNKATVYYEYEYIGYDKNNEMTYCSCSTIEFELTYENGEWKITSVYEPVSVNEPV